MPTYNPFGYSPGSILPGALALSTNYRAPQAASAGVGSPGVVAPSSAYNLNPTPMQGNGPFGMVPGQLGLPNPAGDLAGQVPGLAGLNQQVSDTIGSYLGGELPPDVIAGIRDAAAKFGVTSGMPGSGLARNIVPRDIGLTSLDLKNRGLAAYNSFIPTVSGTQTVRPELQNQIAEQNAVNASAPNPGQAQSYAKQLFDQYLARLSQGGRGSSSPAGGTGMFASGSASSPSRFGAGNSGNIGPTTPLGGTSAPVSGGGGYGYISGSGDYNSVPEFLPGASLNQDPFDPLQQDQLYPDWWGG